LGRTPYEFDPKLKHEAIKNALVCEVCGKPETKDNPFTCHHICSVWFARENPCLSLEVIRSLANLQVVCRKCHTEIHRHESRIFYQELVPEVAKRYLEITVDHSKDEWRKGVIFERSDAEKQ